MAKHDENKDLKLFSRIGTVNTVEKTLKASKAAVIGIRMWGRIDFLTHYCGYHLVWDNAVEGKTVNPNVVVKREKKDKVNRPKRNKSNNYE